MTRHSYIRFHSTSFGSSDLAHYLSQCNLQSPRSVIIASERDIDADWRGVSVCAFKDSGFSGFTLRANDP